MKKYLIGFATSGVLVAHAQVDRAGNVTNDGAGASGGFEIVIAGVVIGAIAGAIYAKHQQSKGNHFATDGGAILGGLIGAIALPLLLIVMK